ncbi:MAG: hypothetical protein ACW99Q_18765, partial [Candidatus Kariarchaeaceae archaeon]
PNLKCLSSHKVLQQTFNDDVIPVTLMRIEIHTSVLPYSNNIHIFLLLIKLIPGSLKVKCVLLYLMKNV